MASAGLLANKANGLRMRLVYIIRTPGITIFITYLGMDVQNACGLYRDEWGEGGGASKTITWP